MTLLRLYELLGLLLGLLFGSFLNVCIARLPKHESIVAPGSRCMACGDAIRWFDNIPILSWIALRGRCRSCKTEISWQYPLVEVAFGLWMIVPARKIFLGNLVYTQLGRNSIGVYLDATMLAILGFLLIGLMVMDWQTQRLPDAFTITGIAIGFAFTCVSAIFHQRPAIFIFDRIAAIAVAALILLLIRWSYKLLRKQDGMGLGDVKLIAMIAAFLGIGQTLLALFVAVVAAGLYGIVLLALRKAHAASRLPFGSFLAAAGLLSSLYGQPIVDWYASFFR